MLIRIAATCLFLIASSLAAHASTVEAELAAHRQKIALAASHVRSTAKTPEETQVIEADLSFAADAAKMGAAAAFAKWVHPQGKVFPARAAVAIGQDGVRSLFSGDKSLWEWSPVEVAASGDLGTTWGIAALSGKDEAGKPYVVTTRYVTVWKRDARGDWKMWLDSGTPGPLPDLPLK